MASPDSSRQQAGGLDIVAPEADLDRPAIAHVGAHGPIVVGEPGLRGKDGVGVTEDVDAKDRPRPQSLLHVRDAAGRKEPAVVDDGERRTELLELGQDVAANHDRLAQRPELSKELPKLDPGPRVEPLCRFVEEQNGRVVDERVGEAQALLHAARQ